MKDIFKDRASLLNHKRLFEARKWSANETFMEYFHEKIIMANRIQLDEEELAEYLIDGIPDEGLRIQAMLPLQAPFAGSIQESKAGKAVSKERTINISSRRSNRRTNETNSMLQLQLNWTYGRRVPQT